MMQRLVGLAFCIASFADRAAWAVLHLPAYRYSPLTTHDALPTAKTHTVESRLGR